MSTDIKALIQRLHDESDLCRNDGADDIANLLGEAVAALEAKAKPISGIEEDVKALHESAAPDNGPEMNAIIPADAFHRFVDGHAEMLHALASGPQITAPPSPVAQPEALPVQGDEGGVPLAWRSCRDGLLAYVLQGDLHNRLTPRVVDVAYSAFMSGRSGKNADDGGPCDWFNDTKPMVVEAIAKMHKDLFDAKPAPQPAPTAAGEVAQSSGVDALGAAIERALDDAPVSDVLSVITGTFVSLVAELTRRAGHDANEQIKVDGGAQRDITIHAAKVANDAL